MNNKRLIKRFLLCFALIESVSVLAAPSEFIIKLDGSEPQYLEFNGVPRLDTAVVTALSHQHTASADIDWLNSAFYDLSAQDTLFNTVSAVIADQMNLADQENQELWLALQKDVGEWRYAQRVFAPLDPDITRLDSTKNPRLKGKWLLAFHTKVNSVWVLGNIADSGKYPWQTRQSAEDYITQAGGSDFDISHVFVIQPNGLVEKHSVANWDPSFKEVAPGAIVYIPLPTKTPRLHPEYTMDDPNKMIIELLRNRIQ